MSVRVSSLCSIERNANHFYWYNRDVSRRATKPALVVRPSTTFVVFYSQRFIAYRLQRWRMRRVREWQDGTLIEILGPVAKRFMTWSNRSSARYRNNIREFALPFRKAAPQVPRDEKPRGSRSNQFQTGEGFGVFNGGSRYWVTGCVYLEFAPSFLLSLSLSLSVTLLGATLLGLQI